jgi:hypothetical protein
MPIRIGMAAFRSIPEDAQVGTVHDCNEGPFAVRLQIERCRTKASKKVAANRLRTKDEIQEAPESAKLTRQTLR